METENNKILESINFMSSDGERLSDPFSIAVISEDSPIFWRPWQEQKLWIDRFELFCCTYSQNLVEQIVSC